jgi:SAM-dependent methyltransferase
MDNLEAQHVNYQYFVHYIKQIPGWDSLKVLDFGCGNGEVVKLLRQEGIDCYGADMFYEGGLYEALYKSELFQKGIIQKISEKGEIPFETGYFDIVISNMVFEHIEDKALSLKALNRVLKDDGFMYHHFPSKDVIREGHMGIPVVHWIPEGKIRYYYAILMRSLGLGYSEKEMSVSDWAKVQLDWLDKYCFYESYQDLYNLFSQENIISHQEIDYCRFRARNSLILRFLLGIDWLKEFYQLLFRRLAFMAIKLRKRRDAAEGISH